MKCSCPYNGLALSRERRLNSPAIHPDATAPIDGCSAVLDGPSNEPAPNQNARECHDVSDNPQSGAMIQPAANVRADRKSDAGRLSPDLSKRLPDAAPLYETAKTLQVRRRDAEHNLTPRRSPIRFGRTCERTEAPDIWRLFEREAEQDLILSLSV